MRGGSCCAGGLPSLKRGIQGRLYLVLVWCQGNKSSGQLQLLHRASAPTSTALPNFAIASINELSWSLTIKQHILEVLWTLPPNSFLSGLDRLCGSHDLPIFSDRGIIPTFAPRSNVRPEGGFSFPGQDDSKLHLPFYPYDAHDGQPRISLSRDLVSSIEASAKLYPTLQELPTLPQIILKSTKMLQRRISKRGLWNECWSG